MAASPSAIVSRQLGTKFAHAVPDMLTWAQERQFFQVQVQRCTDANKSVQAAVANNVERTIESIRDAALACAAMGLSMNPIAQLVYFIPRRERTFNEELDKSKADYETKVPWIIYASPSYRGLAFICTRYAGADDVAAEIVYRAEIQWQKDHSAPPAPRFEYYGPLQLPRHVPVLEPEQRGYKNAVGVYCAIRWPGDRARCEYLDWETVLRIRERSERPNALMWNPNQLWTEGPKKAAVRRAAKLAIQGNPRFDAAERTLRDHEGIIIEGEASDVPRGTSSEEPPKARQGRGMSGLGSKLNGAATAAETAQEAESAAAAAVDPITPVAQRRAPETTDNEVGEGAGSSPARRDPPNEQGSDWFLNGASKHPAGSIEWWGDQLAACKTRADLRLVQRQAIDAGVDKGADAEDFVALFRSTSQRLRNEQGQGRLI